jgi:hypothetical protein
MGFEQSAKQLNALILRALAQQMRSRSTQVGALQIILLLAEHTPRSRFSQHPSILWLSEWKREPDMSTTQPWPFSYSCSFSVEMKPSVYKFYSALITKTMLICTNLNAQLLIALALSMNSNYYWEFCFRHNFVKRLCPLLGSAEAKLLKRICMFLSQLPQWRGLSRFLSTHEGV